jgi:hypothetical protein
MNLNPYITHLLPKCHLVYFKPDEVHFFFVEGAFILGHSSLSRSPAVTFGIHKEICSVVGLGE